jgi:heme-degrading monooxygenase HmoA
MTYRCRGGELVSCLCACGNEVNPLEDYMSAVYELAEFTIPEGREPDFEKTMETARTVIARAPGFISIEYWQGIEQPNVYTILIKWRTLESHLDGWRHSPHYPEWSALVRPFIVETPRDAHFVPCGEPFTASNRS